MPSRADHSSRSHAEKTVAYLAKGKRQLETGDASASPGTDEQLESPDDTAAAATASVLASPPQAAEYSADGDPPTGTLPDCEQPEPRAAKALPGRIGKYALLHELGKGGMGVVYAAHDEELDRTLAVKVMHPDQRRGRNHIRERMRREAQALARLSHPNVVQVYEVGEHQGQLFIALEFIEGMTLRDWRQAEPRTWNEVLATYVQAGQGLAAAHRMGLVHRDFKPGNVMLDRNGRVRVLDFGIARASGDLEDTTGDGYAHAASMVDTGQSGGPTSRDSALSRTLTLTGALVGTPAYMAPEQHMGGKVDARADQFSFCVTLYEALYGKRPFSGWSRESLSRNILKGPPRQPPPGSRVPSWVHAAVVRGLAANADDRHPSMDALLAALARDPRKRRWQLAIGACVLSVVALAGWVGYRASSADDTCIGAQEKLAETWDAAVSERIQQAFTALGKRHASETWPRLEQRLGGHAERWVNLHLQACKAGQRGEHSAVVLDRRMACLEERRREMAALSETLAHADETIASMAMQAASGLDTLERCADVPWLMAQVPLPADPAVARQVVDIRGRLGEARAQQLIGQTQAAHDIAKEAVAQASATGFQPVMAEAWLRQGTLEIDLSDHAAARELVSKAYFAADASGADHVAVEAAMQVMYLFGYYEVDIAKAQDWQKLAEAKLQRVGKSASLEADLHNNLGIIAARQGHYAQALEELSKALELRERASGAGDLRTTHLRSNLGVLLWLQADYERALEVLEPALATYEDILGSRHPTLAAALNNVGITYEALHDYEAAAAHHRKALAIRTEAVAADSPILGETLNNLGSVLWRQGQYDQATVHLERALDIFQTAFGPEHPNVAETLGHLGNVDYHQGRYAQAVEHHRRAVAIRDKALGGQHPDLADSLAHLGQALYRQEQRQPARDSLEQALAIAESADVRGHRRAAISYALAQVLWDQPSARKRARTLAEEARDALAAQGERHAEQRSEVEAWLTAHVLP